MFEKFSDRSAELIGLAKVEAHLMESELVGTEHVLLAILTQGNTGAAEILADLRVDQVKVRVELKELLSPPCASHSHLVDDPPFSPMCERAFGSARDFSLALGEAEVTPEHVLLGLLYQNQSLAASVFQRLGVGIDDVGRQVVARKKRGQSPPPSSGS